MSLIRSKNTKPEKVIRSMLHRMGYRFRLHRRDLPGHPDIVLPKYRAAIFVHGCFWHFHQNCRDGKIPQSNQDYWKPKLERNARRDEEGVAALQRAGWNTLVVWECEVRKSLPELQERIQLFFSDIHESTDN
jgi:DNA mismatch endonuclease (patch repair protein)